MLSMIFSTDFFFSILRIATPILLAAMASVIGEKGGVTNIGLEGIMMLSALMGSLVTYWTKSWMLGLLIAAIIGLLEALLMGFFAFNLKTNIILTGTAVNLIGGGGCLFLIRVITKATEGQAMASTSSLITKTLQIPSVDIPILKSIPILGPILSGHSILTYMAFLLVFLTWLLLYKTPIGLNIRSVGENPNAASSVGVSVLKVRYITIGLGGIIAGLAGAYMSMYYSMGWSQDMVAGRGFIALAAQAMGGGEPFGTMIACLIFGAAQAFGVKLSSRGISSYLVTPIPYAITIISLVIFALSKKSAASKPNSAKALQEESTRGQ